MLRPYKLELALLAHDLLLRRHGAAPRTLAGARVGMRALATHRQVPAVPDPAVRLNFDQTADVHLYLLAEIAFHAAFLLDDLAKMIHFIFRQVTNLFSGIDARLRRDFPRALLPDPVDRGQSDPEALLHWKIYTCNTCHIILLRTSLSLALLVLRVDTNHPHHAAPMDHLALVANLFHRCPYFHAALLLAPVPKCRNKIGPLLISVHNPAARQIVRRELHRDFVSRQNADEILAHLAGNMSQNLVLVFQLNAKHGVRQRLDHRCHDFNGVLLRISRVAFLFIVELLRHSLLFRSLVPLPRRPSHLFRPSQNPRPVRGDRHGVLEVRRGAAVRRVPRRRSSANWARRASSFRCRARQTPAPRKTRSARPSSAPRGRHHRGGCPRASCRSHCPAIRGSPPAASGLPAESARLEP